MGIRSGFIPSVPGVPKGERVVTYGRKFWMVVGVILLATTGLYLDKLSGGEWVTVMVLLINGYITVNVWQKKVSVTNGQ